MWTAVSSIDDKPNGPDLFHLLLVGSRRPLEWSHVRQRRQRRAFTMTITFATMIVQAAMIPTLVNSLKIEIDIRM